MRKLVTLFVGLMMVACQDGGMKKLDNGYEYVIYDDVAGEVPSPGQVVSIDYKLVSDAGEVMNDTYTSDQKPAILVPEQGSKIMDTNPLTALARILSLGDSAMVRIPIDSIPGGAATYPGQVYMDHIVKVLTIEDEQVYRTRKQAEQEAGRKAFLLKAEEKKKETDVYFQDYLAGKYKKQTKTIDGGLKVAMLNEKNGAKAAIGDNVTVQYYGYLKDGTSFDNSYRAGRPFSFQIGKGMVIKGWDVGIPEVSVGSEAILEIPYEMAYGEAGNPPVIPAKSDLLFYILMEGVNK